MSLSPSHGYGGLREGGFFFSMLIERIFLPNLATKEIFGFPNSLIIDLWRRKTSQKPSDELYANFKASFPHLSSIPATTLGDSQQASVAVANSIDITLESRYVCNA